MGADRIRGGDGDDRLRGDFCGEVGGPDPGYYRNVLWGGSGDDWLDGGGRTCLPGNRLIGGPGDDFLRGGARTGYNTFDYSGATQPIVVDTAAGTVTSGESTDRIVVADFDYVVGSRFDDWMRGGAQRNAFVGGSGSDELIGSRGQDYLFGRDGGDTLRGGPDNDTLHGNDGDDALRGSEGWDALGGGPGDDLVMGGRQRDDIAVSADADRIFGGAGNEYLTWRIDAGGVHVDGGPGHDRLGLDSTEGVTLDLGAGTLTAPVVADVISFERVLVAPRGPSTIYGSDADEEMEVYVGGDHTVLARGGDDAIFTGGGDDSIDGGPGTDEADADGGVDDCVDVEAVRHCES